MSAPSSTSERTVPTRAEVRRRLASAVAVAVATAGLVATGAGAANAANSGYAMCMNQANVVGVWVNVSGGRSGWASRSGYGYQQRWSYDTQGRSYSLTVGCGGSPSNWAASTSTPYYSYWSSVSCFPGWSYGFGSTMAANRCYNG
jgi:hypothetical protein